MRTESPKPSYPTSKPLGRFVLAFLLSILPLSHSLSGKDDTVGASFFLQPGDQIEVTFPGAPELNRSLQVRRDGVATFPIIGQVSVSGRTPAELEQHLMSRYEGELVSADVVIGVLGSTFTYYLEGEVRSPGMLQSFRELSALEALIAAGGVDTTRGRLNSVVIMRRTGTTYRRISLDLKAVLDGKDSEAFMLEPYDIVSVPQRVW